jgi:hypothetical protein
LAEMRRVVRRGRRISIATWTQNYELAAELRAARTVAAAPSCLVALWRGTDFRTLFRASGLSKPVITTAAAQREAPSAR